MRCARSLLLPLLATASLVGCGADEIDAGDWAPDTYVDCPVWASDGSSFAFGRRHSFADTIAEGVFVFDTRTGRRLRVSRVGDEVVAWPRPKQLLVLRPAKSDRAELRALDVGTGRSRRLWLLPFAPDFTPVASRDGSVIAFEGRDGVWVASLSDGRLRQVNRASDRFAVSPTVSPDGRHVAYTTLDALYLVGVADGSRRLLAKRGSVESPVFSSDGTAIAYSSIGTGLTSDVFVVELASGKSRQLTRWLDTEDAPSSWAADGKEVLVGSGGGLAVAAAGDGREVQRLPEFGGEWPGTGVYCPSKSARGGTIAFVRSWPGSFGPQRSAVYVSPATLDDARPVG